MSLTDFLNLSETKIVENIKECLPKNITKTLNVLTVQNNMLFTWDFQSHCVLTLNIKAAKENHRNEGVVCQKLLPISPPIFAPEKIIVNERDTLLVVSGPNGVLIFELPSRCPPFGSFNNNKELVYCRTHNLEERLLTYSDAIEVLQIKFHPGSVKDNHILLLTSDNALRLYQIEGEVVPLGVYHIGDKPVGKIPYSKMTFLGALGEIAVDFDFGHPEINKKMKSKNDPTKIKTEETFNKTLVKIHNPLNDTKTVIKVHQPEMERKNKTNKMKERECFTNFNWPVYVLEGDFIITVINIPLYEDQSEYTVKGPIPMSPSNFEYEKRACSIICLNSNPQVICVGSTNGEILQGIVIPTEDSDVDDEKVKNKVDREIYFFEAVDIEMGLSIAKSGEKEGYNCPVFLHRDESRCDRYFATHSAGVHVISIGCMEDLQKFASIENSPDIFNIPSTLEYLVCTKTTTSKIYNHVVGFSSYYNPNSIIVLLSNGNLLSLALLSTKTLPQIEKLDLNDENNTNKSLVKEMLKVPFDQYIQNILTKAESHPIMKLSRNEEHSPKECHELILKTSQIFKEKFKYHTLAVEEIEKRMKTLQMLKGFQLKEIENMNREKFCLQEKAENLAEKYEDSREKQEVLLKRCAKLLMLLSIKKEILSDAEDDYLIKLKEMRGKLDKCDTAIEKLISKKNHQEAQMRNWKSQQEEKHCPINEKHRETITQSLVSSSTQINKMVEEIKAIKKHLKLK